MYDNIFLERKKSWCLCTSAVLIHNDKKKVLKPGRQQKNPYVFLYEESLNVPFKVSGEILKNDSENKTTFQGVLSCLSRNIWSSSQGNSTWSAHEFGLLTKIYFPNSQRDSRLRKKWIGVKLSHAFARNISYAKLQSMYFSSTKKQSCCQN